MKSLHSMALFWVLSILLLGFALSTDDATNPIQKVLELLEHMEKQIIGAGEDSHDGYVEFAKMCEHRSVELSQEIKLARSQVEDLKATIEAAADDESEMKSQIEEIASVASNSEADLKAAAAIRKKETEDFNDNQKDLIDTISQMERAISILEKQQKEKSGASFAQLPVSVQKNAIKVQKQRAAALAEAFSAMIDSSSLDTADSERLASLMQTSDGDADSEADGSDLDAAEAAYNGSPQGTGNIIETLDNLLEKAQGQLDNARSKETNAKHNFEMFQASLQRKIAQAQTDMIDTKKAIGVAGQTRAQAEGDLEITKKDLAEDEKSLGTLHRECMNKAADYQEETGSRGAELKALATAKKVIKEMTGAAEEDTYGKAASFLQVASGSYVASPAVRAVRLVKDIGKEQKMSALLDMAHKMESVIRNSAISGEDPFAKVKSMISSMLGKLTKQMDEEASQKAYCDKEMSDTSKSKASKTSEVDKLQTRIDTQSSESLSLREQVSILQKELLAIMSTQQEMDRMRKEEHALVLKTKPELEQGREGIKKALKVLRKYYSQEDDKSHDAQDSGGTSIIGMLEVVESDIAKAIANLDEQEDSSQAQYVEQTNENNLAKAVKTQDVTYKTKQTKALSKVTSESSTDLDGVQTELDAVNEYYAKIQEECIAKPKSYEERRKRQGTTLQGLQDAMQILQGKAALAQQNARRLRGVAPHQNEGESQPESALGYDGEP